MFLRFAAIFALIGCSNPANADQCFNDRALPKFISQINKTELRADEKRTALLAACNEIDSPFENFQTSENRLSIFQRINQGHRQLVGGKVASHQADMNKTPAQRSYKVNLDRIKNIKDPNERIKQAYNLVVDTMGPYDKSLLKVPIHEVQGFGKNNADYNVENIVDRAKKMGTGGICRHHASLLSWSLNYVSNGEFTSETKSGCNKTYCHMWVGVSTPTEKFDLDSTNHPDFTALNPRLNGFSKTEQKRVQNICSKISKCLLDQIFEKPTKNVRSSPVENPLLKGID